MVIRVSEETWAGARAVVLTSDILRVVVLPEHGARIASIIHLPSGREALWSPPGLDTLPTPTDAMPYAEHPAVGIDECIPTIWPDTFQGHDLPDHGEAWTLPWEAIILDDSIETRVTLRQAPFRFTRRLSFARGDALRLDYTLTNTGDAPAPALWALHPLLRWEPGMRIVLPPAVTDVEIGSVSGLSPIHSYAPAPWPVVGVLNIGDAQLNVDDAPAAMKCYAGPLTERWAALHDMVAGFAVGFAFTVPMVGIWINRGAWGGYTHVAIEPATGISEHLSTAVARGNVLTVPSRETATWSVTLAVQSGILNVAGVTLDGAIRS